jgi:hypothetical protein
MVFVESGTEKLIGSRLFGRGFLIKGGTIKPFFGFIPL